MDFSMPLNFMFVIQKWIQEFLGEILELSKFLN